MLRVLAVGAASLLLAPQAHAVTGFYASLTPGQQVPPVTSSSAGGFGSITIVGDTLSGFVTYRNLTTPLTMAHIHCCAPTGANAGVALDFMSFPLTLSGRIDFSFDLSLASSYRPGFLSTGTAAEARSRLEAAFADGRAYFNLHTTTFGAGEIRGQISAVPEPGTWAMMILGFGLVGAAMRRRRVTAGAIA